MNLELIKKQAKEYKGKIPDIITYRPEGMPNELYKYLRGVSKAGVKQYLNR